jgi:ribosomal-protein-alanine N-acetyltransferase
VGRIPGWPATLTEPGLLDAPLVLRPMRMSDARACREVRAANDRWLRPWDPTSPAGPPAASRVGTVVGTVVGPVVGTVVSAIRRTPVGSCVSVARKRREARRGTAISWAIRYGGQFAGQLTVWRITWGSSRSAEVGYWVDQRVAGRAIMPTALAMAADHCFSVLGLHRLEAGIAPENLPSRRVVEKLGFRDEGLRARAVHIDGAWRDHLCYALTAEEVPAGALPLWRSSRSASRSAA